METRHNVPNIELRSEEVQELMGKIPPVILHIGITVILCFVIFMFIASNFVKYPDIITFPIVAKNTNFMTEIRATESGQITFLNMDYGHIYKNDTLAGIVVNNRDMQDTIFIKSPFTGIVYPCNVFQEYDYVDKNSILCMVIDSIKDVIIAKASIPADLKKSLRPGMIIESNINDILLQGKVASIANYANPITGTYIVTVVFKTPPKLQGVVVWNSQINARVKIAERSIFDKFFKDRIVPTF